MANKEQSLIKSTDFEKLISTIETEKQKIEEKKLEERKKSNLIRRIASAYYFLRKKYDLPKKSLGLEEFKIVEAELKRIAAGKVKGLRNRILDLFGFNTAWGFYLKYGYFHKRRSPFGGWYFRHPWRRNHAEFDISHVFEGRFYNKHYSYSIPPNIIDLFDELWGEECGRKGENDAGR